MFLLHLGGAGRWCASEDAVSRMASLASGGESQSPGPTW